MTLEKTSVGGGALLLHFPAQNWICGVFSLQNVQYLAPKSILQASNLSSRRYRDDLSQTRRRFWLKHSQKKSLLGHFSAQSGCLWFMPV